MRSGNVTKKRCGFDNKIYHCEKRQRAKLRSMMSFNIVLNELCIMLSMYDEI